MTENTRMNRKDLKGPDEFISAFSQALTWAKENQSRVMSIVAGVLILLAAVFGTRSYLEYREASASNALWPDLNRAQDLLRSPVKPDDERLVAVEQFLTAFVNQYPKAEAAVYAHYYLGSIAFTRGNHDIAIAQFKSVLSQGRDRGIMRFLARQGLAQALEAKGDFASASAAYHEAASAGFGDLKAQARLGEARMLTMLGRASDAVAIYRDLASATSGADPATKEYVDIKLARMQ
jgi:predicted negative regulator of RcsB-dependent stress response